MTFTVTLILRYLERKLDGPENYSMIGMPENVLGTAK